MWPFYLLLTACLLILLVQDFRSRTIHWIPLLLVFVFLLILGFYEQDLPDLAASIGFNLGFVLLQIVVLKLWLRVSRGAGTRLIDGMLGLGDILFLCAITPAFEAFYFLTFFVLSLGLILLFYLLLKLLRIAHNPHIPLAGFLSGFLVFALWAKWTGKTALFFDTYLLPALAY